MVSRVFPGMVSRSLPYLDAEVGLLKSRTSHSHGTRLLASRPDAHAVGSLVGLERLGLIGSGGGRLGRGLGDGGFELPGGGGEGTL